MSQYFYLPMSKQYPSTPKPPTFVIYQEIRQLGKYQAFLENINLFVRGHKLGKQILDFFWEHQFFRGDHMGKQSVKHIYKENDFIFTGKNFIEKRLEVYL